MSNSQKKDADLFDPHDQRYMELLDVTKTKIVSTRVSIARAACQEHINLYWWLGQKIIEAQDKYGWGKSIIERLARDLKSTFPEAPHGFSARNLWDMRRFYLTYKDYPNLRQSVAEIPWGQHLVILNKVKDIEAKQYYIQATQEMNWTRDSLIHQINAQAYEKRVLVSKQHNFEQVLPKHLARHADNTLKDVYLFETLGLTRPIVEVEMEQQMVAKIKDVMLELGYGFTFIGNQYRLVSPSGSETFVDLLFFNRRLQSLVALELKVGAFKPEYIGRMNYQLNLLDDVIKESWENPSIGIILCSERNRIDVEYALRGIEKPIGVSEFKLTQTLPQELVGKLPQPKELEAEILKELGLISNEKI